MLSYSYEENEHLLYWPESNRMKAIKEDNKRTMNYTMPGIKIDKLVTHFDPKIKVTQLIKVANFELAVDATSDILTMLGQGKDMSGRPSELNQFVLQVWAVRFQLLLALRLHTHLLAEIVQFEELDAPDLYYQYANPGKIGSLVPFTLRLIHAEALRFSPFPWKSIERINRLEQQVKNVISFFETSNRSSAHICDWKKTRKKALQEYMQAVNVLDKVVVETDDIKEKAIISQALMRMAMQAGDEKAMNYYAEKIDNNNSEDAVLHKTLRSLFSGCLESCSRTNIKKITSTGNLSPRVVNTAAIALLYAGKAKEAVEMFGKSKKILRGPMLSNLKTTAELCVPAVIKDAMMEKAEADQK
ncbi:unnamed protein product [Caenorhabditis auriculariae]|uniref:Uncharacterized protein n=1 Tax=Caenorhabditis auriculariae TaxID=2777116 RepID=A0A8S1GNJ8_9PELO|nr:unnamed protein product [Caenorhabditis auriculariae]